MSVTVFGRKIRTGSVIPFINSLHDRKKRGGGAFNLKTTIRTSTFNILKLHNTCVVSYRLADKVRV